MHLPPEISLIVPTRGRAEMLRGMLRSVAATTSCPGIVEVILVTDADDPVSRQVVEPSLRIRQVVVAPGQTMGNLNMAGFEAARGRLIMLLNDDVTSRTPGWDGAIRACFAAYPDQLVLAHVNDLVFQQQLCTFPIVSRSFCDLAGGICPREYQRYRIDDHIEDCFNLLGVLGERRVVYLPDVVFEHANYVTSATGMRQYFSEPTTLSGDAAIFDEQLARRKEIALRMFARISGKVAIPNSWRRRLEKVADSQTLRVADRQRIFTSAGIVDPWDLRPTMWQRLWACQRQKGWRGVASAIARRLTRTTERQI